MEADKTNPEFRSVLLSVAKAWLFFLLAITVVYSSTTYSAQSEKRKLAIETLWEGYLMFQEGNTNAVFIVEKALAIDPELAYANIVRAEIAMSNNNWETAKDFFQTGLKHLYESGQIFSPFREIIITPEELEAEARTFLGYTFIKLAQEANRRGKLLLEENYLNSAKRNLQKSLTLRADPELKEMAEALLRKFQYCMEFLKLNFCLDS